MAADTAMLDYFGRLLRYDSWANAESLASVRRTPSEPARRWMSHIVGAEFLWLGRLTDSPPALDVWPELEPAACEARVGELARAWPRYLATVGAAELSGEIAYRNTKGEVWSSTVADVLTHVVVHSGYHRGQVATAVREAGGIPAYTDFVHAARQGLIP